MPTDAIAPDLNQYRSILVRQIDHLFQLPTLLLAVIGLTMLTIPLLLAYAYGILPALAEGGQWRALLIHPVMITYIICVIPLLSRTDQSVVEQLRPVVAISDEAYYDVIDKSARPTDWAELSAFGIGMVFGLLIEQPAFWDEGAFWLHGYIMVESILMYGLLAWVISLALLGARYVDALLKQPLRIDIFDISPFEPVGRQSLMTSMAFVIGVTISLIFMPTWVDILNWLNLLLYSLLVLVTVLVFFLNMRPTHSVISLVKGRELSAVKRNIGDAYRKLSELDTDQAEIAERHAAAIELNAWIGLEQRMKLTRTWPYNTEMLRTLAVSVLTPAAIGLSRLLILLLQERP